MSHDPTSLESDLRQLRATPLDASLLDRLEACADETMTTLNAAELSFEHRLRNIGPAPMSVALFKSLEAAVAGTPFPGQGNIVDFPVREAKTPRRSRSWWSAAAAVALLGASAAMFIPLKPRELVENRGTTNTPPRVSSTAKLVPASINRGLKEASNQGVIWQPNQQPQRVLKVVYSERVTLKDANGRTYEVEQPRVEYILVPTNND